MDKFYDTQRAGAELVKIEPLPPGPERDIALKRERLRLAGTHVWHDQHGLVHLEKAEALIRVGRASREEFRGHPETGKVEAWEKYRAALEMTSDDSPEYPSGNGDDDPEPIVAPKVDAPPPVPGAIVINRKYNVAVDGEPTGPFDGAALKAMVKAGRLKSDSLVFTAGLGSWTKAAETKELGPLFPPPPLPNS